MSISSASFESRVLNIIQQMASLDYPQPHRFTKNGARERVMTIRFTSCIPVSRVRGKPLVCATIGRRRTETMGAIERESLAGSFESLRYCEHACTMVDVSREAIRTYEFICVTSIESVWVFLGLGIGSFIMESCNVWGAVSVWVDRFYLRLIWTYIAALQRRAVNGSNVPELKAPKRRDKWFETELNWV